MCRCSHIYGRYPITDLNNQIACPPRDLLTQHVINNCHEMTPNRITSTSGRVAHFRLLHNCL